LYNLKVLLAKESVAKAKTKPAFSFSKWWEKANKLRPIQEEANIDLGHDYDGIRELDNRLPPWWLYGFYCCILFAVIYLYRFHVAHTAPLPKEELQIAMNIAAAEKEAYLKNAANNVNENTVTYLTDPASLEDGKKIFTTICMACHQADGGGNVGPNLTDKYWLHGGSIKDIFKTIKYGWPEKGMKSWEDDYSPLQIAHIASYVKSLQGTKPAKPKEPQGTLYEETETAPAADSAKTVPKQ
jgi:cytochrome c oxidase cbb3-type subunit 3